MRSSSSADSSVVSASSACSAIARGASAGTGVALAKSAASSSFARGVTCYFERREGVRLHESELSTLRELEKRKQWAEDFRWLSLLRKDVFPLRAGTDRQHRAHDSYRAIHIERSRNDVVDERLSGQPKHPIDRREELWERKRERARDRDLDRLLRIGTRETTAAILTPALEYIDDLADLLVLEEAPHQLGARIIPDIFTLAAGQKHLRLYPHEPGRHLEIVGGLVQLE